MTDFDPHAHIDNPEEQWPDSWLTADDLKGLDK